MHYHILLSDGILPRAHNLREIVKVQREFRALYARAKRIGVEGIATSVVTCSHKPTRVVRNRIVMDVCPD